MGKDYCSIFGCHNYCKRVGKFGKKVTLHKLPSEQYTRKAWIRAISRKNWKPTSYTRVCSDHFRDGIGPNSINRNKIPTENLPQREAKTSPKQRRVRKEAEDKSTSKFDLGLHHHSYAQEKENIKPESAGDTKLGGQDNETVAEMGFTKSTQTCNQPSVSVEVGVYLPEIVIESIKHSNELIAFYTGLPDFNTFQALFESLMEHGADKLCTESIGEMNMNSLGRKHKLRRVDEFLMVMMRLRLGLLVKDLEFRFKISAGVISKIFNSWILFMCTCMRSLVALPELDVLQAHIPKCFEKFSDTRIVLDCTEVFIQSPSSLENKSLTYSSYKSHNTFKALVGVSMTGAVVLVSKLWPGSTSDVEITRNSGLFEQLHKGDAVMVDKGFIHIQSDLKPLGVKLYCPPFKSKIQFSKAEVETTRRIASARIHVERKMEQIKNFRILQGVMPLAISDFADHIFFVCTAMTNLLPPLVSE